MRASSAECSADQARNHHLLSLEPDRRIAAHRGGGTDGSGHVRTVTVSAPYRIVRWSGRAPILCVKYYAWTLAEALDAARLANIFEGRGRSWIDLADAPAWRRRAGREP